MVSAVLSNTKKGRRYNKRMVALMLLASFFLVSLLSEAFVLLSDRHDHDHLGADSGCTICALVQSIESFLRQFGTAVGNALLAFVLLFTTVAGLSFPLNLFLFRTPIGLRTRMHN